MNDINDAPAQRINNDDYVVSAHGVFETIRPWLSANDIARQIGEFDRGWYVGANRCGELERVSFRRFLENGVIDRLFLRCGKRNALCYRAAGLDYFVRSCRLRAARSGTEDRSCQN